MKNQAIVNREKWRALNLKINSQIKTTQQNEKAGREVSEEYKNWLKELMAERDELGKTF